MSLELITGSMFSGKTLELIRRLRDADADGQRVSAGKPSLDLDSGWLVSLAGSRWPAEPLTGCHAIRRVACRVGVLGVDEVQFLSLTEIRCLEEIAADGIRVVAAGLDLDFRGAPFPGVERLVATAQSVTWLTATCTRCGAAATHSQRLLDGRPAPAEAPTILLGGRELYEPRCAACHELPARRGRRRRC